MVEIPRHKVGILLQDISSLRSINDILRWCEGVSWILNLQSYMFGDTQEAVEVEVRGEDEEEEQGEAALVPHQHEEGLGAAHQALLQREGPIGFQSFTKPPCFGARIAGLLGLMVSAFFLYWLNPLRVSIKQRSYP